MLVSNVNTPLMALDLPEISSDAVGPTSSEAEVLFTLCASRAELAKKHSETTQTNSTHLRTCFTCIADVLLSCFLPNTRLLSWMDKTGRTDARVCSGKLRH